MYTASKHVIGKTNLMAVNTTKQILLIESFYTGSHRQLIDLIHEEFKDQAYLVTLPGSKWPWRMRCGALQLSVKLLALDLSGIRTLFCSATFNLAELVSLVPSLSGVRKLLYFHENQLEYPIRGDAKDRDFQFGYNQILSCLVADCVVFNSNYCRSSFLSNINPFLRHIPHSSTDERAQVVEKISAKARVLYYPIQFPETIALSLPGGSRRISETSIPLSLNADEVTEIEILNTSQGQLDGASAMGCPKFFVEKPGLTNNSVPLAARPVPENRCMNGASIKVPASGNPDEVTEVTILNIGLMGQGEPDESGSSVDGPKIEDPTLDLNSPGLAGGPQPCPEKLLRILWPHRWEHDKNPDLFFEALFLLQDAGKKFEVVVVGEPCADVPEIFEEAKSRLQKEIIHWGYIESKAEYHSLIATCDVVVSTTYHEFYGVAMLEATRAGAYPMCPKRLVYPEIYPKDCIYKTNAQLSKRLRRFIKYPRLVVEQRAKLDAEIRWSKHSWHGLRQQYRQLITGD